nr:uncharacterized protein LOC109190352 [Ipomoea batatas]
MNIGEKGIRFTTQHNHPSVQAYIVILSKFNPKKRIRTKKTPQSINEPLSEPVNEAVRKDVNEPDEEDLPRSVSLDHRIVEQKGPADARVPQAPSYGGEISRRHFFENGAEVRHVFFQHRDGDFLPRHGRGERQLDGVSNDHRHAAQNHRLH